MPPAPAWSEPWLENAGVLLAVAFWIYLIDTSHSPQAFYTGWGVHDPQNVGFVTRGPPLLAPVTSSTTRIWRAMATAASCTARNVQNSRNGR